MSAYLCFVKEVRPKVVEENRWVVTVAVGPLIRERRMVFSRSLSKNNITSVVAARWRMLSAEEKDAYQAKANAENSGDSDTDSYGGGSRAEASAKHRGFTERDVAKVSQSEKRQSMLAYLCFYKEDRPRVTMENR